MPLLVTVIGALIVLVTMSDVVRVTLAVSRPALAPVRVSDLLWTGIARVVRGRGPLPGLGAAVGVFTVGMWFLLMWLGWSLVFLVPPGAVISTHSGLPAGGWERVYFAGSTLFTLGSGDFQPGGAIWQILTVGAVVTGLSLVTLVLTYLMQVMRAVTEKRQLANTIEALGDRPEEIVTAAATSGSWSGIEQHLVALTPQVDMLAQQHLAFPVLHFFRSAAQSAAIAPALALLDEALLLFTHALPSCTGPNRMTVKPLRYAIRQFLGTAQNDAVDGVDAPPPPDLQRLRDAGVETVDDATFRERVDGEAAHRRLLHGLVHVDGWRWDELWQ
jgi:hypothetical protein